MPVSSAYGQRECHHRKRMTLSEKEIDREQGCYWGHQEIWDPFCHKDDTFRLYFWEVFLIPSLILRILLLTVSPAWAATQIWGATTCIVNQRLVFLSPCDCFSVWQKSSQKGISQCGKKTQQDLNILTSNCTLPGSPYNLFFFFLPAIVMDLLNKENVCRILLCILVLKNLFLASK